MHVGPQWVVRRAAGREFAALGPSKSKASGLNFQRRVGYTVAGHPSRGTARISGELSVAGKQQHPNGRNQASYTRNSGSEIDECREFAKAYSGEGALIDKKSHS